MRKVILTLVLVAAAAEPQAQVTDAQVKAAYILNFTRMVTWQQIAGENPRKLPICVTAEGDLNSSLKAIAEGRTVSERLVTIRVTSHPEPAACRVVVANGSVTPSATASLAGLASFQVLTIGDGEGWLDAGCMFQLVLASDRKLRFDASLDTIRKSGLDVSTQLLRLARELRKRVRGGQ